MVLFNHTTRELTAKIVYYGPGLSGKTTNLRALHERLDQGSTGRLLSLATAQDRTIYFDLLPVELGNIKGYSVRFQLCTVPGQVFYNETRKLVLKGVDGIVFVVDSQWSMLSHNLESFQNLRDNLREGGVNPESIPIVIQYNKRDLPGILSVEALQESLGFRDFPFVEAVAPQGRGVVETFKLASKLTFVDLMRRLQRPASLSTLRGDPNGVSSSRLRTPSEVPAEKPVPLPAEPAVETPAAEVARQVPLPAPQQPSLPPPPPAPVAQASAVPESPFEMTGDIPSPPTDEIFGIPARIPKPPPAGEATRPEPPPAGGGFGLAPEALAAVFSPPPQTPAPLGDEPAPPVAAPPPEPSVIDVFAPEVRLAPPPPAEFEFDLSAGEPPPGIPAGPAVEPVNEPPVEAPAEFAAGPPVDSPAELSAEAGVEPPVEAPAAAPQAGLPAGTAEPAEPPVPEPPQPPPPLPPPPPPLPAPPPPPTPGRDAGYSALERRVEELEGRLERVLAALRVATGDEAASRRPADPSTGSAPVPEDPGT